MSSTTIHCPNCNHANPGDATQCEACLTPLPQPIPCPNCGASVLSDANFCGQCGHKLGGTASNRAAASVSPDLGIDLDPLVSPDPLPSPASINPDLDPWESMDMDKENAGIGANSALGFEPTPSLDLDLALEENFASSLSNDDPAAANPLEHSPVQPSGTPGEAATLPPPLPAPTTPPAPGFASVAATQIQVHTARLLHVQTDTPLELPHNLSIIRIGKPNDRIPPDIDVSGFPHAEVVSRVHAQLRVEGDVYYVEDSGSANGTYVNGLPLPVGNRHRLRSGDRIALGKNDLVSFLFNLT